MHILAHYTKYSSLRKYVRMYVCLYLKAVALWTSIYLIFMLKFIPLKLTHTYTYIHLYKIFVGIYKKNKINTRVFVSMCV